MKLKRIITFGLIFAIAFPQFAYAKIGDMGFFGGVSQGTRLPKTTELILAASGTTGTTRTPAQPYKEIIFLNGKPEIFEGTIAVNSGVPAASKASGTYNETYSVKPSAATGSNASISRDITFRVNYRVEGNQTIRDYEFTRWTETITIGGTPYKLDSGLSKFGMSIIEDKTPGVTYYKGDISQRAVYTVGTGANAATTTLEVSGSFYGYNNAWSSTEAQRLDGFVYTDGWQLQYQVRPSVSVSKQLKYSENEPTAMSFSGNYQEIMQNLSGIKYDIFMKPQQFYTVPSTGGTDVPSYNASEQLIAPDTSYLKGHFAEQDIKKLFAMQVLDGDPKFYQPAQAITRDQYVTALVKAIKLPIEEVKTTNKKTTAQKIVFPDVTQDKPSYPYIMAAFKAGLAVGRSDGKFYSDYPIERQEAIVIMLRTLGLQNLGFDPTPATTFLDDASIASWAKREIYAANVIGLISPDSNGNINPKVIVSKAEAAAMINRLIDYMRSGIADDYSSHIVNYSK